MFTDIEGSTQLLEALGEERYVEALDEHRAKLRASFGAHGGLEVDTQGDAFFYAFADANEALAGAAEAQLALTSGPITVRMGVHTGEPRLTDEGYAGREVHRAARIAAAGHGGQVLVSAATRRLVDGELTELGEHRLKDFAEPVALYQLGSERYPPLKTLSNTNLPRPASSFVGREREVKDVVNLLKDTRLLTLSGPAGSGKTRLAIEAAAELVPKFKAGVFWIPLATVRDPALVTETVAQTLGAKDGLASWIGERELLLLLDNLEQVIEAAPELATLLEACPNLQLLVTSRELLRVRGEVEYSVMPLSDAEAIELFTTCAQLEPDETIAQLCRRLENLPLALELAAARTKALSPAQLLERLSQRLDLLKGGRDAEARQQTLRATIAWSYDLLGEDEQGLFARLAVFRGGCTLETSEAVLHADLDVLQSLVEKNLVRHTDERFWMLETIREYALERLDESGGAADLRRSHTDHYLALAEEAFPNLRGNPKQWLDRLEAEHDNLRAALDRLEAAGETQLALQLAGALWGFWYLRGHFAEGSARFDRLLAADDRPTAARARALNGGSVMTISTGDLATSRARSEEALELHRELGDAWGVAYSIFSLGMDATEEADWERARPYFEESLARFRELDDGHYALISGDALAWIAGQLGDSDARRRGHENVLREARAQSNWGIAASELDQLAPYALDEGRIEDALSMLGEAIRIKRDLEMPLFIVESLCRIASALTAAGRPDAAVRLAGATQALRTQMGGSHAWVAEENEKTLTLLRRQGDSKSLEEALEEGRKLTLDEAVELALSLTAAAAPPA